MALREFQMCLTCDTTSGRASAYLLELKDTSEWAWVADTEFGPFDTVLDVSRWLTRALVQRRPFALR